MGQQLFAYDYTSCVTIPDNSQGGAYAYSGNATTGFDSASDPFATLVGSQTTTFGAFGPKTYEGTITKTNLQNVINRLNSIGCSGHYNTNPGWYRLIGIEHGIESLGPLNYFGASEPLVEAWTAYIS